MLIGMADERVKLEIRAEGRYQGNVCVNGANISDAVVDYSVTHTLGEVPTATLELIGDSVFNGQARVRISDDLRTALLALGWREPS